MKTHQINVTPGEYNAIVSYDQNDFVQLLRPESEQYEVGDILHLREHAPGWVTGRNCYRRVETVVRAPRAVDAKLGRMIGLNVSVWFGERVGLEAASMYAPPRCIEVEELAAA